MSMVLHTFLCYFYPRPPRGGRPPAIYDASDVNPISIHALREEGDCSYRPQRLESHNFYPRPPRGGRPGSTVISHKASLISIHALREEGDLDVFQYYRPDGKFLSTPSARRATGHVRRSQQRTSISIHALREEGDKRYLGTNGGDSYFYPRPPRGGRRQAVCGRFSPRLFLSTPSARRATSKTVGCRFEPCRISIHALREEGDRQTAEFVSKHFQFLSTPSARRATHAQHLPGRVPEDFYPRPPRGGRRPFGAT